MSARGYWRWGLCVAVVVVSGPLSVARADYVVGEGWDLFYTIPGTQFLGVPFEGVPLGSWDFGGAIGVQPTGDVDTIMHRLQAAEAGIDSVPGGSANFPTPPAADTGIIQIELVALQLRSVDPIDMGAGLGIHYMTLQAERGGPASMGEMAITFNDELGGTFDSHFNVFFDLKLGPNVVFSGSGGMTSSSNAWDRLPAFGEVLLDDVNFLLKPDNTAAWDFHPKGIGGAPGIYVDADPNYWGPEDPNHWGVGGPVEHTHDVYADSSHIVCIPEPATLAMLAFGGLGMLLRRRA